MNAVDSFELLHHRLGVDVHQYQAFHGLAEASSELFRVTIEAQAQMSLTSTHRRVWGELSGKLRDEQRHNPLVRPSVGDFVAARPTEDGSLWRIEHVLPRRTQFIRQSSKRKHLPQVIASNVDVVFIVTSPNEDFSPRRLERYIASIHASGAKPVIIINKIDLSPNIEPWLKKASEIAFEVPVLLTNAQSGLGYIDISNYLQKGQTVALVGSSGVGKSTLTNMLLGMEKQQTQAVREEDSKGRHTTTHRELFALPNTSTGLSQGFLVDTPGMRALALWTDPEALLAAFSDIAELAEACRFRNCQHKAEPGCAVRAAEQQSILSSSRLASYLKLAEECSNQAKSQTLRRRKPPRKR